MSILTTGSPQLVYFIERLPPHEPAAPTLLDRIKKVAGTALALLGLTILIGATLALAGYFTGYLAVTPEVIHPFFATGIACSIAGFHLEKGGAASLETSAGPITFSA